MNTHWTQPVWVSSTDTRVGTTQEAMSFLEARWRSLPKAERQVAYSEAFKALNGLASHEDARRCFATLIGDTR